MSRLQAGALGVHAAAAIGVEEAVPRALDDLGAAGRDGAPCTSPTTCPPCTADPGLLERVLVNVIANALRYSPPGPAARRSPPASTAAASSSASSTTAPASRETDRDRVFLPFQRLGDRDNDTGVGLGLALSRGLAEAMGGTLTPETTPGGGLTMVLALPVAEPL